MCRQYPQKHRQRVDRRITDSRGIISRRCIRIRQCGRISRASGKQAYQCEIIQFAIITPDRPDNQQRQHRDDKTIADPGNPAFIHDRINKTASCIQPDTSEEYRDPDLAQHQVGTLRRIGHKPVTITEAADQDRHNQRPSCQT